MRLGLVLAEHVEGLDRVDDGTLEAGLPELGVLLRDRDLRPEREVVADEHTLPGDEAERERLVDRVADADGEVHARWRAGSPSRSSRTCVHRCG